MIALSSTDPLRARALCDDGHRRARGEADPHARLRVLLEVYGAARPWCSVEQLAALRRGLRLAEAELGRPGGSVLVACSSLLGGLSDVVALPVAAAAVLAGGLCGRSSS